MTVKELAKTKARITESWFKQYCDDWKDYRDDDRALIGGIYSH